MSKLSTIQKRNNLNEVCRGKWGEYDENDFHSYTIFHDENGIDTHTEIRFQNGPRGVEGSVGGVLDGDLLEIVRDRLTHFQQGELRNRETACALTHIEEALMWLNKRAEDRAERGVLGTYNK